MEPTAKIAPVNIGISEFVRIVCKTSLWYSLSVL